MTKSILTVSAASLLVHLGRPKENAAEIISLMRNAVKNGIDILVFPELALTGATIGDLLFYAPFLAETQHELLLIIEESKASNLQTVVGYPEVLDGVLYNSLGLISGGNIVALSRKGSLKGCGLNDQSRWFSPPKENGNLNGIESGCQSKNKNCCQSKAEISCETNNKKCCQSHSNSAYKNDGERACENKGTKCCESRDKDSRKEDYSQNVQVAFFADILNGNFVVRDGVKLLLVSGAVAETDKTEDFVSESLLALSTKFNVAIVFANAGEGESVTDELFAGGALVIAENKIAVSLPHFKVGNVVAEIDGSFGSGQAKASPITKSSLQIMEKKCCGAGTINTKKSILENNGAFRFSGLRTVQNGIADETDKFPFIATNYVAQATKIVEIQAEALKRRLMHVGAKTAVIGVSGGLDSTLALIVSALAMKRANRSTNNVLAVTMPGLGTSNRTYKNALALMRLLEVETREISIESSFLQHLKDIGHDGRADIAYENAQARERTQILMDIANMTGGIVVGTGDLSELAMGFATYNGDHMSMYGVNASVPKTLMRAMVRAVALESGGELEKVLLDIVNTPVSPELKPSENGNISQLSESVVGPYELVDFFLYHFLVLGESATEIYEVAKEVFYCEYEAETLKTWQNAFFKRFFSAQFKRSCLPDGVNATGISLSPRGGMVLASDLQLDFSIL